MAKQREIVTLQVGHYSNFIGTHWWNLQEGSFVYDEKIPTDINHDVLFREGKTLNGEETYVPRLISIDLKGSLNTLKEEGNLYEFAKKHNEIKWSGKINICKTEPSQKNEFLRDLESEEALIKKKLEIDNEKDICQALQSDENQLENDNLRVKYYDLDNKIKYWSDFVATHYHPRSVYLIDQFSHENESEPFEYHGLGQQLWSNETVSDSIEEKIRYFTEECDNLQGFHLILDGYDGFGGLGCGISSLLNDEYGSKTVVSIPTFPVQKKLSETEKNRTMMRMYSSAFTLQQLSSLTSIVIPTSLATNLEMKETRIFPFLNYKPHLAYHTSSIVASALDTVTLLYRTRKLPISLSEFANSVVYRGMKVVGLSTSLPFPINPEYINPGLNGDEKNICQSLTFGFDVKENESLCQNVVIRGINDVNFQSFPSSSKNKKVYLNREEWLENTVKSICPSKISVVKEVPDVCFTHAPFPNIFNSHVEKLGFVNTTKHRPDTTNVIQIPVLAGIHCNTAIGGGINKIWQFCTKQNIRRFHSRFSSVHELDDLKEMLENLHQLSVNYNTHL